MVGVVKLRENDFGYPIAGVKTSDGDEGIMDMDLI
jgi:hypothetical protein